MEVRWEGTPPIERIRAASHPGLKGVSVVAAHDLTGSSEGPRFWLNSPPEEDLTSVRQTIDQALSTITTQYSVRKFDAIGPPDRQ